METEGILVATDLSAEAAWAEQRGAMLAQAMGARLDLVHVVADTLLAGWRAAMLGQDSAALLTAARHQLAHATQGIRDDAQVAVESHLLTGVPYRVVLDTADRSGSRLIVAGAHGRHALHALVIGSVTEKLLYRTESSPADHQASAARGLSARAGGGGFLTPCRGCCAACVRAGVERWLVGSVAAHMARVAQCDVLVVPVSGAETQPGTAVG